MSTDLGSIMNRSYYGVSSGFFNSVSSNSNSNASNIFDYKTISSGSYYKLMKAYYNGNDTAASMVNSAKKGTTAEDEKNAVSVRDNAQSLRESATKLVNTGKDSVFNKKTVTKDDNTTAQEYDKDAIYKAVKSFVDDYNDTLDKASGSNYTSVLSAASNMVSITKTNSDLLSSVGVSVSSSNKLSIDEDTFKNANMTDVKSLFNGIGSYAYNVATKASTMYNASVSQIAQINGSSYSNSGNYSNYSYSGSLYSSYT